MNLIDRLIAPFAPRTALARAQARRALDRVVERERSYAGAARGERLRGFSSARGSSANAEIGPALATLRDRARALVRDTPHGARIVDVWAAHAVGTGIVPVWNTGSDRLDRQVGSLWDAWTRQADVTGDLDFYGLQALAMRSVVEGGETLVRFVPTALQGRVVPLRLQLMEGDHIDSTRDGTVDGRRVRLGIALGDWDRREGVYLFDQHPGEALVTASLRVTSRFHAARDVRRVYRPLRIGQLRGVSRFAPLLLTARDLADLIEATLVKANVEACFAGFYTGEGDPVPTMLDENGNKVARIEPGMLTRLPDGSDIRFAQPTSSTQFDAVALAMLQAMAVGAGVTYDQVTGDLRRANYSSLRAGKIEFRRLVEQDQWHVVVPMLCDPVADRFVETAITAGLLRSRAEGYPRTWVMPANEPIDPKKDLEADVAAVRAGRMAPQEFIAQWGRDWRKVLDDFAGFMGELDRRGLALDIDPRRAAAGAAAPSAPAAADSARPDPIDPQE